MDTTDPYNHLCAGYLASGRVRATIYRRGALVTGWPSRWPQLDAGGSRRPRGIITSQSARSLLRAAFAIRAAEVDWKYMLTLTFRVRQKHHKEALRWMCRCLWRDTVNQKGVGWFLEYQERGVEHYHLLMDERAMLDACWPEVPVWRKVRRNGQSVSVLSGEAEERIASHWEACAVDFSDEFRRFQRGGIFERLANPERAHDYLANYCRKLAQKTLPPGLDPPGRWWWISDHARPVARRTIILTRYNHLRPLHMVRSEDSIDGRELFNLAGTVEL